MQLRIVYITNLGCSSSYINVRVCANRKRLSNVGQISGRAHGCAFDGEINNDDSIKIRTSDGAISTPRSLLVIAIFAIYSRFWKMLLNLSRERFRSCENRINQKKKKKNINFSQPRELRITEKNATKKSR